MGRRREYSDDAERQRAYRQRKAQELRRLREAGDLLIAKRGAITPQQRRLAVQRLIKDADPEADAALLAWLEKSARGKL